MRKMRMEFQPYSICRRSIQVSPYSLIYVYRSCSNVFCTTFLHGDLSWSSSDCTLCSLFFLNMAIVGALVHFIIALRIFVFHY